MVDGGASGVSERRPRSVVTDFTDATTGAPLDDDPMVCQDEWTRLYPSERYEWRGRSCFYKAQWNQCDTFAAVCAATCKAKDCGAELAPLRTSVLHRPSGHETSQTQTRSGRGHSMSFEPSTMGPTMGACHPRQEQGAIKATRSSQTSSGSDV